MRRPSQLLARSLTTLLLTLVTGVGLTLSATPQAPQGPANAPWPPPIDPPMGRDQYDMTWDDYVPIPGTTWNDPSKVASVKTIRLAILAADFPDQPFVMTLPKNSDKYG